MDQILIYKSEDGRTKLDVRLESRTVWLNQKQLTELCEVAHYNLDMVLALGFRVRSPVAVRFRQWAADKLKEYIVKGFVLDEKSLGGGCQNPRGVRVRRVSQDRGPKSRIRFRPRRQAVAAPSQGQVMKLHFEPNLGYQLQAVEAVCDLFRGTSSLYAVSPATEEDSTAKIALAAP